ncbi:hypothetical protein BOTBODRAFT_516643 [Botryobasidium botryosum FD-172 SS1]|uniref:Protein kinase domain-containing protein n=1 Tax=Botryobasidium botryosum (strain FD-172 SS1) TaxID=930990 RepID=A0A067N395_BOTB1|nr:hypothetical protein BOTBODRAFT_516643 [Botryobasidium botryosum FD-172 SS1]
MRYGIGKEMPAINAGEAFVEHDMKLLAALYSQARIVPLLASEIQDYEVTKEAGSSTKGGFGECHRGHLWGTYPVALKCLQVNTEKANPKKYFLREVHVWAGLRHRRILPLIGMCTLPDGATYMVSPWMQHGNIMSYLKINQDVDRLLLLEHAAEGLEYLHANSVVHGDVRGPNVLVSESGDACVADFGLSMLEEQTQPEYSYSSTFHRAGNPRWMAPELLMVENSVRTTTTDVFSFGRLILEVLTGNHPFPNVTSHRVVLVVIQGPAPDRPTGDAVTRGLDDKIWALIQDCTHVNPDLRPTMSVVLSRLHAARAAQHPSPA